MASDPTSRMYLVDGDHGGRGLHGVAEQQVLATVLSSGRAGAASSSQPRPQAQLQGHGLISHPIPAPLLQSLLHLIQWSSLC
jgi:hypothetical protein